MGFLWTAAKNCCQKLHNRKGKKVHKKLWFWLLNSLEISIIISKVHVPYADYSTPKGDLTVYPYLVVVAAPETTTTTTTTPTMVTTTTKMMIVMTTTMMTTTTTKKMHHYNALWEWLPTVKTATARDCLIPDVPATPPSPSTAALVAENIMHPVTPPRQRASTTGTNRQTGTRTFVLNNVEGKKLNMKCVFCLILFGSVYSADW